MRDFEEREIISYKCHTCGCKNKMYTELRYHNRIVGYELRCCNCGDVKTFTFDNGAQIKFISHQLAPGRCFCIQPSYCPHKKCKLYGTYKDGTIFNHHDYNENHDLHKKSNSDKLIVNAHLEPKFL